MIRKLFHKLCYILLFFLSFAPVPLIGGHILLGQPAPAFVLMVLTVPLALLLTLVPGRIGGKIRHQVPAQPVTHRFETESDQRFLAEDAAKRSKPLRAPLCALIMAAFVLFVIADPFHLMGGEVAFQRGVAWFHRAIMGILTAVLIPLALNLLSDESKAHGTSVMGFILYFIAGVYLLFDKSDALNRALYVLGLCFLIGTALTFNSQSLTNSAAGRRTGRPSRRMLGRNRLLLAVLGVIGLIVLYFDQIRVFFTDLFKKIVFFLWDALLWLTNLFFGSEGGSTGTESSGPMEMQGLPRGEAGAFWVYTEKILVVIAVLAVALLLLWLGKKIYRLLKALVLKILGKLRNLSENLGEDYVDEQESLMDWGEMGKSLRDEWTRRLKKLTEREKKWEQMDPREKIRFLVRGMYKRAGDQAGLSSLTIHEAAPELPRGGASAENVAALYDQARYSPVDPTHQQAEQLRKDVKG